MSQETCKNGQACVWLTGLLLVLFSLGCANIHDDSPGKPSKRHSTNPDLAPIPIQEKATAFLDQLKTDWGRSFGLVTLEYDKRLNAWIGAAIGASGNIVFSIHAETHKTTILFAE